MNIAIVKYVDEEGVNNAIIDNPWGGTTHIATETAAGLDAAVQRELSFIKREAPTYSAHINESVVLITDVEDDPSVTDEPVVLDCY